jgi:hypothetical protein
MDLCTVLSVIIVVAIVYVMFFMRSEQFFLGQPPMLVTPPNLPLTNPYYEICGNCVPSDEDPDIWQQQCVVKNGQRYPLLYYTMTKTCAKCQLKNGVKTCQNYKQPGGVYQGSFSSTFRPTFCGNVAQ